ncbi:MAG TPA: ABC transporter ATP-binding protein [Candidatus Binatia bacterium]|nr:ABC transporter ATP-binding protein [Candidatus Binatia bacterium]
MIRIKDLVKSFQGAKGEVHALRGVSFEVSKGQLFTLLGPSGCGKTTTLRCIAGLEQPLAGEISVNDRPVFSASNKTFVPPEQRRIGMVFQSYAIWPHMTVFQNVAYPLASGMSRKELASRVEQILERLSLGGLADRLAPNLSGGQQQRVALARALVAQPEVLLLDEPLSNLDAKLREQMRFELKALHESLNITTVYVTHDQEEALALSDQIGLMHEGALLEVGAPTELYLRPAHWITADFLGTANFVPVQVKSSGNQAWDEMVVESPLGTFVARRSVEWREGLPASLFFRPEHVEFFDRNNPSNNGTNTGSGIIERATFLGNSADVMIRCGEIALRVRAHPTRTPAAGKQVHFSVAPEFCIVFPASPSAGRLAPSPQSSHSERTKTLGE